MDAVSGSAVEHSSLAASLNAPIYASICKEGLALAEAGPGGIVGPETTGARHADTAVNNADAEEEESVVTEAGAAKGDDADDDGDIDSMPDRELDYNDEMRETGQSSRFRSIPSVRRSGRSYGSTEAPVKEEHYNYRCVYSLCPQAFTCMTRAELRQHIDACIPCWPLGDGESVEQVRRQFQHILQYSSTKAHM